MPYLDTRQKRRRLGAVMGVSLVALAGAGYASADSNGHHEDPANKVKTASPIKHVIVVIGENRGFDHTFATYRAKHGQAFDNLLAKGIINADGTPGPNFQKAQQFSVPGQNQTYFIGADKSQKVPFTALPGPDTNGAPQAPSATGAPFNSQATANIEPDLEQDDKVLLTTGFTGLPKGPDARISGRSQYAASGIPNGPYQISGANASPASVAAGADEDITDDDYTGDTTHRFYTNWQQSDCAADAQHVSKANPSGCLQDLFPWVMTTYKGGADEGVGNSMAFYNNQDEDAAFLADLANNFTVADNMHQSVWGGTAVQHIALGTADAIYWTDGHGNPAVPTPASMIANPNPVLSGQKTVNQYTVDGNFSKCADFFQPGVGPIVTYLNAQHISTNCEADHYYMLNNVNPGFLPNGALAGAGNVPPSPVRTIGDALNDKNISWAYYGGGYNAAVRLSNIAVQLNPTAPDLSAAAAQDPADAIGVAYCQICNPFQYASSIMADPKVRTAHMKDVSDLDTAIADSTLPAVSYVKPDGLLDGHPASSKVSLFEGFVRDILDRLDANPKLKAETAVLITFDEAGGYFDSGYVQPIDYFGDSNRIPLIIVSPYSTGGAVTHTYFDHVSIVKFIERNWKLQPLTGRSRDNLPNPVQKADNPYVPKNSPALGDLFDAFDFDKKITNLVNFNPTRTASPGRI